nr:hypothetical protein [Tanacetum cinerariifolium]
ESGFYAKLNAIKFVPQTELSREQAYWLNSHDHTPSKPVTPFVRKGPPPSHVLASLHLVKVVFPQFESIIIERTTKKPLYISVACFDYAKEFAEPQLTPFYEHFKKHIEAVDTTIRKEEKDDTIRHLHAEKDILGLLNVGSTKSSFKTKALETEIAQLKEGLTFLKIQNDGYKVTNANLNKCYQELSKANTHLRTTSLEKIATQKVEIATLKAEAVGKKNSGLTGQVTFLEPHRTSPRSIQKPPVQHKKPTIPVNMFRKAKPTIKARKPIPKRNTQNHNPLPAKKPIVKPSKLTPCVSPSTNATLSLEPILELVELFPSVSSLLVRQSLWSLGYLTIDSAIARLVPMGYLVSFTDEILV